MIKSEFSIRNKFKSTSMPIISDFQMPHTIVLDSVKYISSHRSRNKNKPIYNFYLSQLDIHIAKIYMMLKKDIVNLSIEDAKELFNLLSGNETIELLTVFKNDNIIKDSVKLGYIDLILNIFEDIKVIADSEEVDEDSDDFQSFWNDLMAKETEKHEYFTTEEVFA